MTKALSTIILFACWMSCFGQGRSGRPMVSVDTVADLATRNPVPNERVLLSGLRTAGDYGAQRIVRHVPASAAATNLGCVFTSVSGRYFAEDCEGGIVDARWFGAVSGFLTNASDSPSLIGTSSTPAVQAATDYLSSQGGGVVVFGPGTFWFDESVNVKPRVKYRGASKPTGFIASRSTSGSTARISGITYIEGEASDGTGFPLFVLDGPSNYTNMFSESFVNLDGDTLYYYSGANEFSDIVFSVYKWGWGKVSQGPVSGIFINQVDGVRVQDCSFNNIAGTGLWAQAARGMQVYNCTFMNCLVESMFVAYSSDTRVANCLMGVGGVVYYRANSNVLIGNEIWNPDYSLVNYSGTDQVTNIVEYGVTRRYAIERTIVSSADDDWFYSASQLGADNGTMVFFTGATPPAPLATNTPYFAVNVSGNTNVIRLATSPQNALAGTYIDITESLTNGTWHITGSDANVYASGSEEIFVLQNRMDQSFRHGVELHSCNRSSVNGNQMWEIGANMGPSRRNTYLGPDVEFAGVFLDQSGNIQINDNLFTGGYAFGANAANYRNPVYGVLARSSGGVEATGNRFKSLNTGVYADSNSLDVRTLASFGDRNVSRIADSAATNGVNTLQWNGIKLNLTNVVVSDAIPDAFTNLTDFTIVITGNQADPYYVGSTNQAYMPLLTLGSSTNYTSTDAFAEGAVSITQYYLNSFSTNWQWLINFQGSGTNYRRGSVATMGEDVVVGKPFEVMIGRSNGVWWTYFNGIYAQNAMATTSGASPPAATNAVYATRLLLGYWPITYRDGWIGSVALFNRGFSYSDVLYERVWNYGTNLVLHWDFRGDQGSTVTDKSGNGINGTAYSPNGASVEFGPDGADGVSRFQLLNTNLTTVANLTGGTSSTWLRGDGVFTNLVPIAPTNNGAFVLFVTNGVASWIAQP